MPFQFLSNVAKNDNVVKYLFDSVKNVGVIALVCGAAKWRFEHLGDGYNYYLNYFFGSMLYITAWSLFFIFMENALHKIKELTLSKWQKAVLNVIHGQLFLQLFFFIIGDKLFS